MAIHSFVKKNTFLIMAIFFFFICALLHSQVKKPVLKISKQNTAININHKLIKIFSLGQSRLLADFLWVITLLESDVDHYKNNDLESWMFLRFKSIIELDPKFLNAYQFGGKYLSIVKDDLKGSRYIFEQGLVHFPNDYELIYNLAFLLAFEIGDYPQAIKRYKSLLTYKQTPVFIKSLIIKLEYEKSNDLNHIYLLLKDIFDNEDKQSVFKEKIQKDLYAIKAQRDLECLNNKKRNCETTDFLGNPYLFKNNRYQSLKEFTPYKLNIKNGL